MWHKKQMQAQLSSLLERQVNHKEEASAEAAVEEAHQVEAIKAAWRREEEASAAAAAQERARKQADAAATMEANR